MSGILPGIKSALAHPKNFLAAHHISTSTASGDLGGNPFTPAPEGTIPFTVDGETHRTWYMICGDLTSKSAPLVVVHGGGHDPRRPERSPVDLVLLTPCVPFGPYF